MMLMEDSGGVEIMRSTIALTTAMIMMTTTTTMNKKTTSDKETK